MTVQIIISSKKVLFTVLLKKTWSGGPGPDLGQDNFWFRPRVGKKNSILVPFRPDPSQKQISVPVPEAKFSYRGRARGPLSSFL